MTNTDELNVIASVKKSLPNGLKIMKLSDMDEITKLSLIEKHIISPEFALENNQIKAIALNEEENICIMINEEDHLRIQSFSSGLNLKIAMEEAINIEKNIGQKINFSFLPNYGFLTSCPSNVGTGLRASVMVHLPALTKTQNIEKVLNAVNNFGMTIRGIYGEGTNSTGNLYQISNKHTLGITEEETIQNLNIITDKVIEQEKIARKIIFKNRIGIEDEIYRAYGILTNCKKISSEESIDLLSKVRLGVNLGIINEITEFKLNKLELFVKPANLQKHYGQIMNSYERDIKRAELIKQIVNE